MHVNRSSERRPRRPTQLRSRRLAISAPSTSAFSFSRAIAGSTFPMPAKVAKPDPAKTHPTPAPPSPAEKLASGPGYRAQLGAFRSKAKAVRARMGLTDALEGVVDERLFAIDDSGNDGFVRVVLSRTFATRRAATAACAVIKERGRDCFVARIR